MGDVVEAAASAAEAVRPGRRRRPSVRFSAELGRAICARVAAGETVQSICRDEGMPSRGTVTEWAKSWGAFGKVLKRAKALGGWDHEKHRRPRGYDEVTAREIFARVCEGEALSAICKDPGMPGQSTVARWRERVPEFAQMMALGRQVQAERFCDLGWEIASAVTPGDAYATHVKLTQLRWTAAALAPKRFGRIKPVDAAAAEAALGAAVEEKIVYMRHFKVEEREDGSHRVISFKPDFETGGRQLVRETPEDAPWEPPIPGRWRESAWLKQQAAAARGAEGAGAAPGGYDPEDD